MARFSRAIWNELRDLTPQEVEIIRRFESDAQGTLFVAAAEVLRKRGYIDETIVVMEDGIRNFPQYQSARASLARDYFLKGMMAEALHHVTLVVQKSIDNVMAQRLKLKLDLLLGNRTEAQSRLALLKQLFPDDEFTRTVRDLAYLDDWGGARAVVIAELQRVGVHWNPELEAPGMDGALERLESSAQKVPSDGVSDMWEIPTTREAVSTFPREAPLSQSEVDESHLPPGLRSSATLATVKGDPERYLALKGFRRVQSEGLFSSGLLDQQKRTTLDQTTLAEIYATQGLFAKAIAIYERALKGTPDNGTARKRLEELHEIFRTTHPGKPTLSPIHSKAMRMSPEAERKLRFLETLLERLDSRSKPEAP